jgi:uncharacterized protein involved in exopolysaccharide biosynthesis
MKPKQPHPLTQETPDDYRRAVRVANRLQKIGRMIDRELEKAAGERVTFTLMVHAAGRTQYVSNGQRENMREVMQELLDRWETNPDLGIPQAKLGGLQ